MKLIYITSYTFPSRRAEPYYLRSMADAFVELAGVDFQLMIRGNIPSELEKSNAVSVKAPERFRTGWYFFWFPFFLLKNKLFTNETIFISNDPYLLSIFVFWKKIIRAEYRICSDWHQLFDDWKDKYIAENSDYLISTSKRLKNLLGSVCGVPLEKILVAYGGIDVNLFAEKVSARKASLREKLNLPVDAFLVGYVGGFRSVGLEKGLSTMIRALPYLEEHIRMVFVGGTKEYIEEYEILAKELHVAHRCIFVGKQQFEKVIEYEISMDILAIPYPDQHHFRDYGFPMKVWEYMASGRPIVYSNLEIIGEILEGRGTAFKPDDAQSFAHAVISIKENNEASEKIAKENLQTIQNYTWKARVEQILDFVQNETFMTQDKK